MALTFDGASKTITVSGVTSQDVQGMYSDWKEWVLLNPQWLPAFRTFGGDPTVAGQTAPRYFFLINGWRVLVDGIDVEFSTNLYTQEGDEPVIPLNGGTAIVKNSDSPTTTLNSDGSSASGDCPTAADIVAEIRPLLEVINQGVKDGSILVPHTTDLP